ncbi:MAG TPA: ferredoxin family protein [Baekduia sp.]|nr:ferredoxin family protein [Baekduia sp.]
MAYVITGACLGTRDLSCAAVCPVDCIYELVEMCVISPDECIDCGACVTECPAEAITSAFDVAADQQQFVAINAAWDESPEKAQALVTTEASGS